MENYDFDIHGSAILWRFYVLNSTNIALFNITLSVPVSLNLYQIIFTNNTDSEITGDKHNSRTTIFFTHIFLEENQSNINVLKNDWVVQQRGFTDYSGWKIKVTDPILSDSLVYIRIFF